MPFIGRVQPSTSVLEDLIAILEDCFRPVRIGHDDVSLINTKSAMLLRLITCRGVLSCVTWRCNLRLANASSRYDLQPVASTYDEDPTQSLRWGADDLKLLKDDQEVEVGVMDGSRVGEVGQAGLCMHRRAPTSQI